MALKVPVQRWTAHGCTPDLDPVAEEQPLEIFLVSRFKEKRLARSWGITLRTPGHDEELALGLLFGEGRIASAADVEAMERMSGDGLRVVLAEHVEDTPSQARAATAACGLCGSGRWMEAEPLEDHGFRLFWEALDALPDLLRGMQETFSSTGGVHAAALFDSEGSVIAMREDIGRHNAVDKVIGWALREQRVPLHSAGLLLSGRAGYELIHKAAMARIPFIAAIGAPTSLSVSTANRLNQTIAAFVRPGRATLYTGSFRLQNLQTR
jgi:FdhD protein